MFDALKKKWLTLLADPVLGPQYTLLLTETKSPWGWREVLQPRVTGHDSDGADVELIADDATAAGTRKLVCSSGEVLLLEQFDLFYREASGGAVTAGIDAVTLKLEIDGKQDRRLPEFTLNHFYRGDAVLKFGKIPLGWVIGRGSSVKLTMIPNGPAGQLFDLAVDLLVRREPLWLMEAAGLVNAGAP